MEKKLDKKYKKIPNNENTIEIDGKVVLSFDPRYKEYLKWRDENPDLEQQLIDDLEHEIRNKELYNNGAPHESGDIREWYNEDGQLILSKKNLTVGGGEKDGLFTNWYKNGQKKDEGIWNNGKLDGVKTYWYENGQKKFERTYKDGKKDGLWTNWYENGQKMYEIMHRNNKREGKETLYHKSGNISSVKTYKDGTLYGEYIDYFVSGEKRSKGNIFYGGMMEGKWTFWYHNGKKELEFNLDFGNPVGSAKIYNDNGILKEEVTL
jgi:antitoxin component YwqK of YwqJK toxin-antitoxin module